jgi:threonine/homoserine/homoserine lactone efflux protein
MISQTVGELLPAAAGIALSPFPIVAIILLLSTTKWLASGVAFTIGWLIGLTAISFVALGLALSTNGSDGDAGSVLDWLRLAIGVALIALAIKKWTTRPRDIDQVEMPGWMKSIDSATPTRAVGLGLLLGGLNPKNLAFALAATAALTDVGLDGNGSFLAVVLFVLLSSTSVIAIVIVRIALGQQAQRHLEATKAFMLANNNVIMMVVLLILGTKILGDAISALTA